MAKNDPMNSAMDDITSVADELHKLHLQAKQYESSSKRMSDISNVLIDLSKSVKQMEGKFSNALSSTEAIQESLSDLLQKIPDVIERVEASDATRSISEFSNALTETKEIIESNKVIAESLNTNITSMRDQHGKTIKNVATNTIAIAELKSVIEDSAVKLTENVSTIKATLASDHALVIDEFRLLAEGNKLNSEAINNGFDSLNSSIESINNSLNLVKNLLFILVGLAAIALLRLFN